MSTWTHAHISNQSIFKIVLKKLLEFSQILADKILGSLNFPKKLYLSGFKVCYKLAEIVFIMSLLILC